MLLRHSTHCHFSMYFDRAQQAAHGVEWQPELLEHRATADTAGSTTLPTPKTRSFLTRNISTWLERLSTLVTWSIQGQQQAQLDECRHQVCATDLCRGGQASSRRGEHRSRRKDDLLGAHSLLPVVAPWEPVSHGPCPLSQCVGAVWARRLRVLCAHSAAGCQGTQRTIDPSFEHEKYCNAC